MKRVLGILFVSVIALCACSDDSQKVVSVSNVGKYEMKLFANGERGVYENENELFRGYFDSIRIENDSDIVWSHLRAMRGDTIIGVYANDGECILDSTYRVKAIFSYKTGIHADGMHFFVTYSGKEGAFIPENKVFIEPKYEYLNWHPWSETVDGNFKYIDCFLEASIEELNYYGLLDCNGNIVIPFGDYYISDYSYNWDTFYSPNKYGKNKTKIAFVIKDSKDETKKGIYGKTGVLEVPMNNYVDFTPEYDEYKSKSPQDYLYWVAEDMNGTKALYDRKGNEIISAGLFTSISYNGQSAYKTDYILEKKPDLKNLPETFLATYLVPGEYHDEEYVQLFDKDGKAMTDLLYADVIVYCNNELYIMKHFPGLGDREGLGGPEEFFEILEQKVKKWINYDGWEKYDKNKHRHLCYSASRSASGSESGNESATKDESLIKSATYILSGQGYNTLSGQWLPGDIGDRTINVKFYDDHITVDGAYCEYQRTLKNGTKIYEGSFGDFYGVTPSYGMYYEVDDNYNGGMVRYSIKRQGDFIEPMHSEVGGGYNGLNSGSANGSNWSTYYNNMYRKYESLVKSNINTLKTLESTGNNGGTSSYAISNTKTSISNAQSDMRRIRNEAQQHNVIIPASPWENAMY